MLSLATFVIFFQAFMVAPIIPRLSEVFGVSPQEIGLIVPAYLIPYGIATLVYGLLADRLGLWRIMAASLLAFAVLTALTATARSVQELVLWRLLTGLGASGVVPLALVLVARLYSYEQRGRPLGWIFGAMAGGMAFGSTFGALLEPYVGWQGLFLSVGAIGLMMLIILLPHREIIANALQSVGGGLGALFRGYRDLLSTARGRRTYTYVFVNSIFHSGVFTWLGLYLERHYELGPVGIGLALLGYGIPGFLFGPAIGRAADRYGRSRLIPLGLALGAIAAAALVADMPLFAAAAAITVLSLGYDMTQPLFAGLVTSIGAQRPGQAMGLNVFMLFVGFGLGSLVFGELLRQGFTQALAVFAAVELVLAFAAIALFRAEVPASTTTMKRT
ncbi:MFS transporter [Pseudomonas sp. MPR-R2A7]|nr:MFS transporter [Pseudomonas sp. GP01-A9]PMU28538.1 MFS transporter [Pseudomonas sp. GP01-A13]PMU38790.1 MFS transporter [Pseudomonas sp. GP01-A8]PMU52408.1 MFS transporter [Pseudomonas sp. GP01-A6]PMU54405.1 MFS transporter [Pseudomonas sp. GP01-A14]PMU61447.1 MFS transporter [Pseudomonas sp. GP01-A3]PMU72921.1 MFS transporter [Pseudomonas sp. GP01-A1]PMU73303.1 MFS transporter [Pseudomonas sp. FW215-L2]PMU81000.1 MFS transporter [Pseudomonas sp. GP01-A5]PMV10148.1 MFS transporter [Pse